MQRATCLVVGAGRVGQELLERLSRDLDVVCVDRDPGALERAREVRQGRVRTVEGDATSRLVLEDAGAADAQVVALTVTSERVNLEVARVLREHFDVPRIVAVGITPAGIEAFRALGVEVEGVLELGAIALRNRIESRARVAQGIGLGRDEIVEADVHPRSRLVGKPLSALRPRRWQVALVYRGEEIVVPHGNTVLRGGDRVVLAGDPGALRTVVELLTLSFRQFPLEYGSVLTACLFGGEDDRFFQELAYVARTFPLEPMRLVLAGDARDRRAVLESRWSAAGVEPEEVLAAEGPLPGAWPPPRQGGDGLVVVCRRCLFAGGVPRTDAGRKAFLRELVEQRAAPLLLAAGTFPYERLAVPAVPGVDVEHAVEALAEIAPVLGAEAAVLLSLPSPHMAAPEDLSDPEEIRKIIAEMALAHRVRIEVEELAGNPVRATEEALHGYHLAVLDTGGWRRPGFLRSLLQPDPPWLVVRHCPASTLLLPPDEEAL
ncbi:MULTISPECIES: potassium channel family protein [Deferrisoma]